MVTLLPLNSFVKPILLGLRQERTIPANKALVYSPEQSASRGLAHLFVSLPSRCVQGLVNEGSLSFMGIVAKAWCTGHDSLQTNAFTP